jgi:hypothetical protein
MSGWSPRCISDRRSAAKGVSSQTVTSLTELAKSDSVAPMLLDDEEEYPRSQNSIAMESGQVQNVLVVNYNG